MRGEVRNDFSLCRERHSRGKLSQRGKVTETGNSTALKLIFPNRGDQSPQRLHRDRFVRTHHEQNKNACAWRGSPELRWEGSQAGAVLQPPATLPPILFPVSTTDSPPCNPPHSALESRATAGELAMQNT